MENPTNQPGVTPGEGGTPAAPPTANQPAAQPTQPAGGQPTAPQVPAAPPAGGEGQPAGGKPAMVPQARFDAEVSRWRTRAMEATAKLSAQSLVPSAPVVTPAAPASPSAATPAGEPATPAPTPETQFVTREELARKERVDALAAEAKTCLSKYDGSNGYPVFDLDKVTEYMKENGLTSYEAAYQLINGEEIKQIDIAAAVEEATKNNTPTTIPKGGEGTGQPPAAGEISREGIAKMPIEEYKKMGGAKALRDKVIGGQVK